MIHMRILYMLDCRWKSAVTLIIMTSCFVIQEKKICNSGHEILQLNVLLVFVLIYFLSSVKKSLFYVLQFSPLTDWVVERT